MLLNKHSWRNIIKNIYVLGILMLFILAFSLLSPKFLHPAILNNLILTVAPMLMVSAAATMPMVSGYVDLSTGSLLGFSGVVFASICKYWGWGIWPSAVLTMVIGLAVGLLNGYIVVKLKVTPVIATLATMNIFLGIAKLMCGDQYTFVKGGLPEDFIFFGRGNAFGLPVPLYFIIITSAIFIFLQMKTKLGRYSIAIGGNRIAAELSGINVSKMVMTMYVLIGMVCAMAGVVRASNLTIADATAGAGFELDVIIAILLGGTSFLGGEGIVLGSISGAFILAILAIGLNLINVPSFYQYVVKGIVLILAIILDRFVKERIAE